MDILERIPEIQRRNINRDLIEKVIKINARNEEDLKKKIEREAIDIVKDKEQLKKSEVEYTLYRYYKLVNGYST